MQVNEGGNHPFSSEVKSPFMKQHCEFVIISLLQNVNSMVMSGNYSSM